MSSVIVYTCALCPCVHVCILGRGRGLTGEDISDNFVVPVCVLALCRALEGGAGTCGFLWWMQTQKKAECHPNRQQPNQWEGIKVVLSLRILMKWKAGAEESSAIWVYSRMFWLVISRISNWFSMTSKQNCDLTIDSIGELNSVMSSIENGVLLAPLALDNTMCTATTTIVVVFFAIYSCISSHRNIDH